MPADQETIRYTGVYGHDRDGNDHLMREVPAAASGAITPTARGPSTSPDSRNLPTGVFTTSRFPLPGRTSRLAVDSGGASGRYPGWVGREGTSGMLQDAHFASIADRSILAC